MNRADEVKFAHLKKDLLIILVSVVVAFAFVRLGVISNLISLAGEAVAIGSFIAGFFFTSFFTIAVSTVALAELAEIFNPVTIALWGAIGAMVGDLVLFIFVRDFIAEDIKNYFQRKKSLRLFVAHHIGFIRIFAPLLGGLIIASPLPDELAISIFGLVKMKTKMMLVLSFIFNFIGILIVCGISRALL